MSGHLLVFHSLSNSLFSPTICFAGPGQPVPESSSGDGDQPCSTVGVRSGLRQNSCHWNQTQSTLRQCHAAHTKIRVLEPKRAGPSPRQNVWSITLPTPSRPSGWSTKEVVVKHVEVRLLAIQSWVAAGRLRLMKVRSAENVADVLTKQVSRDTREKLCALLSLRATA